MLRKQILVLGLLDTHIRVHITLANWSIKGGYKGHFTHKTEGP